MAALDVQRTNRRALLGSSAVLIAFLIIGDGFAFYHQHQRAIDAVNRQLDEQLFLLGEFAVEALLRSDYTSVRRTILTWAETHEDVISAQATTPNGFALVEFRRDTVSDAFIEGKKDATFEGRSLLNIYVTVDISKTEQEFFGFLTRFTVGTALFVVVLGGFLWRTLQRTALRPLEAEIRRRERTERELVERTARLETVNKELESFAYSVSHDLRTPLRGINGFSIALMEEYADVVGEKGQDYLRRIRAATQRMGQLIEDLLRLAHITRMEVTWSRVDVSALAADVVREVRRDYDGRDVRVEVEPGLAARGDKALLRIALEHLIDNAFKYTAQQPSARIEIGETTVAGQTVFFVRDNGAGFASGDTGQMFKPFQRLHADPTYPGTGIGLATVARILDKLGGRVWAEAKPNEGATFYFELPAP